MTELEQATSPPEQPAADERIPLTRPVTVTIHEPMFIPVKLLAKEITGGSVSELVRLLLYNALLTAGKITPEELRKLRMS